MPRYSEERKEAVLRKMLPPHNRALAELARLKNTHVGQQRAWPDVKAARAELKALADKLDQLDEDDYPTLLEQLFAAYGQPAPKLAPT